MVAASPSAPVTHTPGLAPGLSVEVRVPGSSANLGPGFDGLGLALGIWDSYVATVTSRPGLVIELEGYDDGVPTDARHLVFATFVKALGALGVYAPDGLHLVCRNTLRQGRGLGSSAAAIVAGIAIAQGLVALAGETGPGGVPAGGGASGEGVDADAVPIDLSFTNSLASALEGHPDNASASVYGGMTISWLDTGNAVVHRSLILPVRTEQVRLHPDVVPLVFVPEIQLPTATARAVLPTNVPHRAAALNSTRAALLVLAASARPDLLVPATREWLHQDQRRTSLGGAMEVVDTLRDEGHAAVISGAGPSVLVLTTRESAEAAASLAPSGWSVVQPGVPDRGVDVRRATLSVRNGQ